MSLPMGRRSTSQIVRRADVDVAIAQFEEVDVSHVVAVSLRSYGASEDTLRSAGFRMACHPKPVRAKGGGAGVRHILLLLLIYLAKLEAYPGFLPRANWQQRAGPICPVHRPAAGPAVLFSARYLTGASSAETRFRLSHPGCVNRA